LECFIDSINHIFLGSFLLRIFVWMVGDLFP
jgi:hypothetical protein